jgi:hypothetical protein
MRPDTYPILATLADDVLTAVNAGGLKERIRSLDVPEELVYASVREGLAGILYRGLKQNNCLELIEPDLAGRLAQTYYHAVRAGLRLESDLVEVLETMADSGISLLVLQGAALQDDLYPEPGLRPLYDIDVWVLPPDFLVFSKVMQNCGYAPDSIYPGTFRRGATVFDVHTHLFWADRIRARRHLLAVPQEEIFRSSEPFEVGAFTARRLNRYDQVLYLGMHLLKHNVERLIWLVDIQLLLAGFKQDDWEQLIKRAGRLGQARILAQVLFLLDEILPVEFPDGVRRFREVNRLTTLEKWVLHQKKREGVLPGWSTLVLFTAGMVRGQGRFIWETFFPEPEVMQQVFPEAANLPAWRLYVKRVFQLAAAPLRKGV